PAVQTFHKSGLVQIADNSTAMVEALRASEHLTTLPAVAPVLRDQVRKHSWTARADQVATWLERL
ncbi:MAG: hypothetical protein JRG71_13395, partial [Deltaproteobacteria bacterium]|nr:hypothetical protein [Deltaproteobacteria bacterium]